MENLHLQKLAAQLNLTQPDDEKEPYLLTPEDEQAIILNYEESLRKYAIWRMQDKGLSSFEIQKKLAEMDFSAMYDAREILDRANSNKNYDQWQKCQREKEKLEAAQKQDELKKRCTSRYMYNLMEWTSKNVYQKDLIVNEQTKPLIKVLCFFLSRDPRFETELGYNLKKGLLLRGVSGLGKTHLVKCLEENELNPICVLSMVEITNHIQADGEYQIEMGNRKILYLDDVGTESPVVKYYGTERGFFKNFIELYYHKNKPFENLMLSTNNSFSELEEKYGFRVRSRIKDMFNVVDVTGKDLRGL